MAITPSITPADIFEAARMPLEERPVPTDPDELQKMLLEMFIETPQWQEYGVVPGDVLLAPLPSSWTRNNALSPHNSTTGQVPTPRIEPAAGGVATATAAPPSGDHLAIAFPEGGQAPLPPTAVQWNMAGVADALVPPPTTFHFNLSAPTTAVARAPTARKDNLMASRAPRPYMPATVYAQPPLGPSKRTMNLKASHDTGNVKQVAWNRKVRLPRAHVEELYERSIKANPNDFTCPVIGCGRVSKDTPAHKSHVLSHAHFEYPCSYCGQMLSSEKNQSYHMRQSCKNRPGAKSAYTAK